MMEPLTRVAHPSTFADRSGSPAKAITVVANLEVERITAPPRGDDDSPSFLTRLDAVLDRVLDERLQDESRYECVERGRFGVDVERQPPAEPRPHDLDVALEQLELSAKRDALAIGFRE
jgi:hypothetical protein